MKRTELRSKYLELRINETRLELLPVSYQETKETVLWGLENNHVTYKKFWNVIKPLFSDKSKLAKMILLSLRNSGTNYVGNKMPRQI